MKELPQIEGPLGEVRDVLNGLANGNFQPDQIKKMAKEALSEMDQVLQKIREFRDQKENE